MIRARTPRGAEGRLERVTDAERVAAYLEDAAHVPGGRATEVVFPRTERQVADVLRLAGAVLPIGAQSSLTGGATPRGETLLSSLHLRSLESGGHGRVHAGAGVTIAEVNDWLRTHGAFYPPGPTFPGATVGGTVATNAAGAATFKHGTTRAWVDALTIVLASGDVLDLRRGECLAHPDGYFEVVSSRGRTVVPVPRYPMPAVPKLSAGYYAAPRMDLIDLFIGAEGTLGVVTHASLRVVEAPATCLVFVTVPDRVRALALVERVRDASRRTWQSADRSGLDVSAIEHMDRRSLGLLREDGVDRRLGLALDPTAEMGLLLALDLPRGTTASDVYEGFATSAGASDPGPAHSVTALAQVLEEFGLADAALIAPPGDEQGVSRLLALREGVPLAVNARVGRARRDVDPRIEKTAADVIVPFDRFAVMLDRFDSELRARGLDGAVWGHISDGNVHPNVIPRSFADVESGREAVLTWGREAIRLGGAPLAEHGVGRSTIKQQLLLELYGTDGVEQMRAVKRALDPEWKLAPGVLFPSDGE